MIAAVSTTYTTTVWYTMRATGIVALVLLTATLVLGTLTASRVRTERWPAFAQAELHKRVSVLTMVFVAIHVLTAVIDTYVRVGVAAVVVPFASAYRPLWTGLGTAAVDLLLAVAVTSALRQRLDPRVWRFVHWSAYACWPLAVVHGLAIGTDAATLWMDALTGACILAVLVSVIVRILDHRRATEQALAVGAVTRAVASVSATHRDPATSTPTRAVSSASILRGGRS